MQEKKNLWQTLISMGAAVINKTKYGTAMDSILILVAIVTIPCFIIYAFIRFWPLLIIGSTPIIQFFRAYNYFMKHDRNMLRTEKHEETLYRIASALGQKGKELNEAAVDALPAVKATNIIPVAKPNSVKQRKEENV